RVSRVRRVQLRQQGSNQMGRAQEADSAVGAARVGEAVAVSVDLLIVGFDFGGNADELAFGADRRAAAVAMNDARISLDPVAEYVAAFDNACTERDACAAFFGITDDDEVIEQAHRLRIAQFNSREERRFRCCAAAIAGLNAQQGEIVLAIDEQGLETILWLAIDRGLFAKRQIKFVEDLVRAAGADDMKVG